MEVVSPRADQPPSYEEAIKCQPVYQCVGLYTNISNARQSHNFMPTQNFCVNTLPIHFLTLPNFPSPSTEVNESGQDNESDYTIVNVPSNYVVSSVLACLCCFSPTGLYALVTAVQAEKAAKRGDMDKAYSLTSRSRFCIVTSILIGFIWITTCLIIWVSRVT